jgi:hypothetical protein
MNDYTPALQNLQALPKASVKARTRRSKSMAEGTDVLSFCSLHAVQFGISACVTTTARLDMALGHQQTQSQHSSFPQTRLLGFGMFGALPFLDAKSSSPRLLCL